MSRNITKPSEMHMPNVNRAHVQYGRLIPDWSGITFKRRLCIYYEYYHFKPLYISFIHMCIIAFNIVMHIIMIIITLKPIYAYYTYDRV